MQNSQFKIIIIIKINCDHVSGITGWYLVPVFFFLQLMTVYFVKWQYTIYLDYQNLLFTLKCTDNNYHNTGGTIESHMINQVNHKWPVQTSFPIAAWDIKMYSVFTLQNLGGSRRSSKYFSPTFFLEYNEFGQTTLFTY